MSDRKEHQMELKTLFFGLQSAMLENLKNNREIIHHMPSMGEASELHWIKMLNDYLPKRYQASKGFVIDHHGSQSDQIDILIYDRQYSPFLFNDGGIHYIPAESVYAAIEVKQTIDKKMFVYAGKKIASIRKLERTSCEIVHAGGTHPPKKQYNILGGIIALEFQWKGSVEEKLMNIIVDQPKIERIDLGCALSMGSFSINYDNEKIGKSHIEMSIPENALIIFFLKLLDRLQKMGTVPAMDIMKYIETCQ